MAAGRSATATSDVARQQRALAGEVNNSCARGRTSLAGALGRDVATIRELQQELQASQYRQEKMKSDFEYNLKLLEERDTELEHYDRMFSEYSVVLKSRDSDIADLRSKLSHAEGKLDDVRRERGDECRRLTKELAEQKIATERARNEVRETEQSLSSRVNTLQENLQAKQREVVSLQDTKRETARALEDTKHTENSLRARISVLQENSQEQCKNLVALQDSARTSKQALDEYEHKFEALSRKIRSIESNRTWEVENERKAAQQRVASVKSELEVVARERDELKLTIKEMKESHASLQRDKNAAMDEVSAMRLKLDAKSIELVEKESELAAVGRKCHEHATRLEELRAENSRTLERQREEFQANAEELRRAVTAQRATASKEKRDAEKKIERLESELRKARLAVPAARSRRDTHSHGSPSRPATPSPCPSSLLSELAALRSRNTSLEEQLTRSRNEVLRFDDTALRSEIVRLKEALQAQKDENLKLKEKQKFFSEDRNRLLEISNKLKAELSRSKNRTDEKPSSSFLRPTPANSINIGGPRFIFSASGDHQRSPAVAPTNETNRVRSTPATLYPTVLLDGRSSVRRRFGL